jgi:2-dehydro-3-deoxygalactonokinase
LPQLFQSPRDAAGPPSSRWLAAREAIDDQRVSANRLIGVDWGTTHRRGYLVADGALRREAADAQGALASRGRFGAALDEMVSALGADASDTVVMSGMVGSAFGWREAPYLGASVPLAELASHLVAIDERRFIVPGYACADGAQVDVLRGEEMQLLGALALGRDGGWFVLPGTHGKWVRVERGRIVRFWTFMTGEVYAALLAAGTLASAAAADDFDAAAFDAGFAACEDDAVTHALFGARARVVTGRMPVSALASYVSGVLVGAEWWRMRREWGDAREVVVIGAPALARTHARAAATFGVDAPALDPRDVYVAALTHVARTMKR